MHVMRISNRSQVAFTTCTQGTSSSWQEPVRAHLPTVQRPACMGLTALLIDTRMHLTVTQQDLCPRMLNVPLRCMHATGRRHRH